MQLVEDGLLGLKPRLGPLDHGGCMLGVDVLNQLVGVQLEVTPRLAARARLCT
jgi:hypothetical protein